MTKLKSILVVLCLAISSSLAFAQHEDLILKYHEKNNDFTLKALFKNVGVIDNNTSAEELLEVIAQFYQEKDIVNELDQKRHEYLVEGVSKARSARKAHALNVLSQGISNVSSALENGRAAREAQRLAEAARVAEQNTLQEQQRITQNEVEWSQGQTANNGSSVGKQAQSKGVRDLYTSDMNWNKMVDNLNQQYGPEKTRQMVQEMRNQKIQDRTQATSQSSEWQQKSAENQRVSPPQYGNTKGVTTAVTTGRTQIYLDIQGGFVQSYATRKDAMGNYNWKYVGAGITKVSLTPYASEFGNEYSKAANISGIGYVFFN